MKSDIFALLNDNAETDPIRSGLMTISLHRTETHYLMFFTLVPEKFTTHYDEDLKSPYLCLGADCPACVVGVRATEHIYLPVWDVQNRRIAILRFDTRPDGPARPILGFLKTYQAQLADIVAVVACKGNGEFTITAHRPLPETDRGALACQAFCDGLEAGAVDLRSCVKRLAVAAIAALPAVKRRSARLVGDPVAPSTPAMTTADPEPVGESVTAAEVIAGQEES